MLFSKLTARPHERLRALSHASVFCYAEARDEWQQVGVPRREAEAQVPASSSQARSAVCAGPVVETTLRLALAPRGTYHALRVTQPRGRAPSDEATTHPKNWAQSADFSLTLTHAHWPPPAARPPPAHPLAAPHAATTAADVSGGGLHGPDGWQSRCVRLSTQFWRTRTFVTDTLPFSTLVMDTCGVCNGFNKDVGCDVRGLLPPCYLVPTSLTPRASSVS